MECKKMFFFVIFIMIFLPLTSAIWPIESINDIPVDDGTKRTCKNWIEFYGINDQNYLDMIVPIQERDYEFDMVLSRFFVGYAYRLTISTDSIVNNYFNIYLSPTRFCNELGLGGNSKKFEFEALNDVMETCTEFIYMYGYSPDDILYNRNIASSIKVEYQPYESNWSVMYRFYMKKRTSKAENEIMYVTPSQFCANLGKTEPARRMPFVSHQDISKMSCEDIIKLYDYTDNPLKNYKKARTRSLFDIIKFNDSTDNPQKNHKNACTRSLYDKIKFMIPGHWIPTDCHVLDYIQDLKSSRKSQAKTIKDFCDSRGSTSSHQNSN